MSSREILSMDTSEEDSDSFVSDTNAIIYDTSDYSNQDESLISDPNILNSSSTSEHECQQQQISTAAGGGTGDDLIVSSCASSSWFKNNKEQSVEYQEIRIFNVDFRALSKESYVQADKSKVVDNPETAAGFQTPTSQPLLENHVPNQSQMNHGIPLLNVSSESFVRPLTGISVYHHRRYSSSVRIRWTTSLHAQFIHAVELLGGHERANPKSILEIMDIENLSLPHVKSHLQMYRTVKNYGDGNLKGLE